METIRILQEQYEKESKKANIPVPPIVTIDDYDKHVAKDFKPPAQYQKYKGLQRKTQRARSLSWQRFAPARILCARFPFHAHVFDYVYMLIVRS